MRKKMRLFKGEYFTLKNAPGNHNSIYSFQEWKDKNEMNPLVAVGCILQDGDFHCYVDKITAIDFSWRVSIFNKEQKGKIRFENIKF